MTRSWAWANTTKTTSNFIVRLLLQRTRGAQLLHLLITDTAGYRVTHSRVKRTQWLEEDIARARICVVRLPQWLRNHPTSSTS